MTNPITWWNSLGRPFARLGRVPALLALAALALALVLAALSAGSGQPATQDVASPASGTLAAQDRGDIALYRAIQQRVEAGEPYHAAAVIEHRARNYPTMPFVTVRAPTLTYLRALLGGDGLRIVAIGLLAATILAWERKLAPLASLPVRAVAAVLLYLGGAGLFSTTNLYLHELLAGLLLSLAAGLYGPRLWWIGLIAACLAVAIREIAVPFLLLWLVFAVLEAKRREVLALLAALAAFAAFMVWHHAQVAAVLQLGDMPSQGWTGLLGPGFVLESLVRFSGLALLPAWLAAPLALLPLVGWAGLGARAGLFASLWFLGYFLAVSVFAREANTYWVLLMLPAYAAGLALAPRTLGDLAKAAFQPIERQP